LPVHASAIWALVELIEAAARSGAPGRAADALQLLSETARASGTDWALGTEARSRALVSDGPAAEKLYLEAIDRFGRARLPVDQARACLIYGEWLRHQRRRRDARDQLASASEIFDSIGAAAFAERARTELRATGGHARQPAVQTPDTLTAQEALIARLTGEGASNPEIAAQLFISRATVAYHLRKVFTKLGVTSRNQLAPALPARRGAALAVTPQGLFLIDQRTRTGPVLFFTSFYLYSLTRGIPHARRAQAWPRITRFDDRWRWLVTSVVPASADSKPTLGWSTPACGTSLMTCDFASIPCLATWAAAIAVDVQGLLQGPGCGPAITRP
jgi:DNA-binding CsgD family transcriptional regulator